jgi:hypothetical protein
MAAVKSISKKTEFDSCLKLEKLPAQNMWGLLTIQRWGEGL